MIAFVTGAVGSALVLWSTFRTNEVKAKFDSIPNSIGQVLPALATAGVVVDANDKVLQATKTANSLGLIQGSAIAHIKIRDLVQKARATKKSKPRSKEFSLDTGIGDASIWVSAKALHLGEGFVLILIEDRSEQQSLEETRRDFIANISHELKTPIGAIGLLAEALQSASQDPAQVKKFAKSLELESARLNQLVQDIIQLSRVQSSEVATTANQVDVRAVVTESVARNQVLANRRKVELKVRVTEGLEVFGDAEMLTTATKNLIENAINYSQQGSSVSVMAKATNGAVEIAVKDKGVGIAPQELDRVFERFYRVDQSRSRTTGGTGIGLSLVKNIAAKHLGEVSVKSRIGKGSTFYLRLPIAAKQVSGK